MQPSSAAFMMLVLPSRITGHGGHGLLVPPSRVIKAHPFGRPSGSRRAEGRRKLIPNRFGWPPTATNAQRIYTTPSVEGNEVVDRRPSPATPNVMRRPFRVLHSAEGGEAVDQLRSPPAAPSVSWITNLTGLLVPPSKVMMMVLNTQSPWGSHPGGRPRGDFPMGLRLPRRRMLVPPSRVIRARPFGRLASMPSSFSFSVIFGFFTVGMPDFPCNLQQFDGVGRSVR